MNKQEMLDQLIHRVQTELDAAVRIAEDSRALANHDEMKKEDKHDTRGTEAKYLAGAQQVRVEELTRDLNILKNFQFTDSEVITLGSLVTLSEGKYFISPSYGGLTIGDIQILSSSSPLARAMIRLEEGEDFEIEIAGETREYEVLEVI